MVLQIKQLLMMTKKKLLRFEKNDFCIYKFLSVRFNLLVAVAVAAAAPSIYNPTRIRVFCVFMRWRKTKKMKMCDCFITLIY